MLRVRLAGGLRLERDGEEIAPPRSRRARALLAWLAVHPGMHARGELAGRFWPDVLDESARTSLRAALTELRGALGSGAAHLVATREAVGLDGDAGLWVDVRAAERLLSERRTAEAVETCPGELLAGMDEEWVHAVRAEHAERMGEALERLAAEAEADGDLAEAVRRTRAAVALDPLAEERNRRLIQRLAAAGDRASAVAAYEHLAGRLRASLGLAPSAATRELLREIRAAAGESPTGAALVPPAAVLHAAGAPFVGRDAELAQLRAAWAGVRMHRGRRLMLLAGEPGVGKTRLALRFAHEALDDAAVVLLGRCSEEPLRPYEPFAEMLRQAGDRDGLLEGVSGGVDDAGARYRLFDAVDAALSDVAGERPLLILLDDLHWADRPTLLLLGFVLRSVRRSPVLVAGSYRTTELGRHTPLTGALAELQRSGALQRVVISGLAAGDVAALAGVWLGPDAAGELGREIHTRTAGNAFFVEEVLRGLAERGSADAIPESVRHAVAIRLARLSPDADQLLGVAAVLGLEVDLSVLEAVAALPAERAEAGLDELVAAHLLRAAPGSRRAIAFPHALVRETVYSELNALRRTRLHRRAADVLIRHGEERRLESIAHHLFEAADAGRAADYLLRAGERAMGMLAYEEAAGFFARAAEASGDADGRLLLARGDALLHAGESAAARECFAAATAHARRTGDDVLLARAALGHAGLGVSIIEVDTATVALLEEALDALGERHPVLTSQVLARLAIELYYTPARDRSEALSAEAVAVARAARDPRAVASALNARHVALWRPDRLEQRHATAEEMIEAAHAAGDRRLELQARNWLVVDLWERGDIEPWREQVDRHAALADELRLPAYAWYAPLWAAVDALHAGRFAEAAQRAEAARVAGTRAGDRNAPLFLKMLEFQGALLRGDLGQLDLSFVRDKIATSSAGMAYRCSYAWILAERGDLDGAREQLAIVGRDRFTPLPFDANWPSAVGECAAAISIVGDRGLARPLYELLAPYAGRPLTAGRAITSYGAADRHLGLLALVLGRDADAVAHLQAGVAIDAAAGMRPWVVHGRLALVEALGADGRADVIAEANELGLTGLGAGAPAG